MTLGLTTQIRVGESSRIGLDLTTAPRCPILLKTPEELSSFVFKNSIYKTQSLKTNLLQPEAYLQLDGIVRDVLPHMDLHMRSEALSVENTRILVWGYGANLLTPVLFLQLGFKVEGVEYGGDTKDAVATSTYGKLEALFEQRQIAESIPELRSFRRFPHLTDDRQEYDFVLVINPNPSLWADNSQQALDEWGKWLKPGGKFFLQIDGDYNSFSNNSIANKLYSELIKDGSFRILDERVFTGPNAPFPSLYKDYAGKGSALLCVEKRVSSIEHLSIQPSTNVEGIIIPPQTTEVGGNLSTRIIGQGWDLDGYARSCVDRLNSLRTIEGYCYKPFEENDARVYLNNPSHFSFSLKKEHGLAVMQTCHIDARRALFNGLPLNEKIALAREKFTSCGLLRAVSEFIEGDSATISEVRDIGVNKSVYLVSLACNDGRKSDVVIKQEDTPNQELFYRLMRGINWPVMKSRHVENEKGQWEISEFLPGPTVGDLLRNLRPGAELLSELGRHAALGDVLGMGDRHLDNKIFSRGRIYEVDLTYLFMDDNDLWTQSYIEGGMYELCSLLRYGESLDELIEGTKAFVAGYRGAVHELHSQIGSLRNVINLESGLEESEILRRITFLGSRLNQPELFCQERLPSLIGAFEVFYERKLYKELLQELTLLPQSVVKTSPVLQMYALADKGRLSCFFMADKVEGGTFQQIRELATQYLNVRPERFEKWRLFVKAQCDALRTVVDEQLSRQTLYPG